MELKSGRQRMEIATEKFTATREVRRLRRQARREKQRLGNTDRAAKMRAARLEHLPPQASPLPSEKIATHDATTSNLAQQFFVGCSGWFYWDWREIFYPAELPTNQWFNHYADRFKTVELNAPFYSWPTVATVKTWVRQAGRRRFIYTVKVCDLITHVGRFEGTQELVQDFGYIADLLGAQMGCFLFQLPPSFDFTPAQLKAIVSQLDPRRRNVVEFRHVSWWNQRVYDALREQGIIFCSCSGPRHPDELIKTADDIYVRFHGVNKWYRHDYTKDELAVWAKRIRESGAAKAWVYFNNDHNAFAIKNARALLRLLKGGG